MLNVKKLLTKLTTVSQTVTLTALGKTWTFKKIGQIVYIEAPGDSTNVAAGNNAIGSLPVGMRPATLARYASSNLYGVQNMLSVATNGSVVLYSATAASGARNCAFSGVYIAASL